MIRTWGHLRVFVPKGGCPLHIRYSVGQMQLPAKMHADASDVLQALHEGGVIEIKDADAPEGAVLGRSLDDWAKAFPGLDMDMEQGPTDERGSTRTALIQGKSATCNTWEGQPCLTVSQLRVLQQAGLNLDEVISELARKCPSYVVGSYDIEIEI